MKTPARPFARFGALAFLLLVALPAEAINVNPAVTNRWAPPRPYFCRPCANFCPVRPPVPNPGANGSNPGSSGCPTCDDESPHPGIGSVSFWQRFGRTPLVAGAPIGRMEIYEIGAARLPSGADVLRYNHPLMRRIVDRDDASDVVVVEEGNGWAVVYRGGVPVGASTGADLEIRKDAATGLFVEQLEDRTQVFYGADNTVDHLVTPDGLRLDWTNAGLDVVWEGTAIGQVWSKADGLMDVTKLSPSSFRMSWYAPASVPGTKEDGRYIVAGNPTKTFTFSYSEVGGEHRLSLLEWRNETFHFDYLWKSADGLDWTLVRDPDGMALSEAMSSTDASGLHSSVRTYSDANGVLRRTTESYRYGANGATLVRTGVIETNGADVATWAASRIEEGPAAGRLSSTTNQYGGATIYTYDGHGRLLTETTTVFGSLEEVTSYVYETNRVDGFVDRRPRHRIVTRDGVVVSDTAYDYGFAPDGGRLDTVTRSDPVSGVSLVSSRLYYPVSPTNAAEAGRIRLSVSEDHTATLYAYAPTANGGYVRTATHGYIPEPDASAPGADALRFAIAPSQSTRTVETVTFRGDVVRVDEFVHTGEQWSPAGWTTYSYNLAHRKTGFADHKGDWEASDWICTGPVWQNLADGTAVTNTFDKAKRLATSTHYTPFGAVTKTFEYNATGQVVAENISTNGVFVRASIAEYDNYGRKTKETDSNGGTTRFEYDRLSRTMTRTAASGETLCIEEDGAGHIVHVGGNMMSHAFLQGGVSENVGLHWVKTSQSETDSSERWVSQVEQKDALDRTVRLETPVSNNDIKAVITEFDSLNRLLARRTEVFNSNLQIWENRGPCIQYYYDSMGNNVENLISVSNKWRSVSEFSRYCRNNDDSVWKTSMRIVSCSDPTIPFATNVLKTLLFPLEPNCSAQYEFVDISGFVVIATEKKDRPSAKSEISIVVPWSTNEYRRVEQSGQLVFEQTISGICSHHVYDALGNRIESVDGRGLSEKFEYDRFGKTIRKIESTGAVTSFVYDNIGNLSSIRDASDNNTFFAYDMSGRRIAEWGNAYPVLYRFDRFGRKTGIATTRIGWRSCGPENIVTNFPDVSSNQFDITSWSYDERTGLVSEKIFPDGSRWSYSYDWNGALSERISARQIQTNYRYDDWGELSRIDYSDTTPAVWYVRDGLGRILSAETSAGQMVQLSYDAFGKVTNEWQNGRSISRGYDEFKRISWIAAQEVSSTFTAILYNYSPDGRLASLNVGTNQFSYSFLAGTDLPKALVSSDGFSWCRNFKENNTVVSSISNRFLPSNLFDFAYEYDFVGRVRQWSNSSGIGLGGTSVNSFNSRSELLHRALSDPESENPSSVLESYTFDEIGNRLCSLLVVNGETNRNESYLSNRLNQYSQIDLSPEVSIHPAYDEDGNLISDGLGRYFSWDAENRLVAVSNLLDSVTFVYDPFSRIVFENHLDRQIWNLWDGRQLFQTEILGRCETNISRFVWGLDVDGDFHGPNMAGGLVVEERNGQLYYPCYDGIGNIVAYVDALGNIVAEKSFDSFGKELSSTGLEFEFWFATKHMYSLFGLVEYAFRFYDSEFGRWINRDPFSEDGEINLYCSFGNNPIGKADCLGLATADKLVRLVNAIKATRAACRCKKEFSTFFNCVLDDLCSGNEEMLERLDKMTDILKTTDSVIDNAEKLSKLAAFVAAVAGKEATEQTLNQLSEWLGDKEQIVSVLSKIASIGASASRKDALDLILTLGAEVAPKILDDILGFYADGYRTAVEMFKEMKYFDSTIERLDNVADLCKIGESSSWEQARIYLSTPPLSTLGCEDKRP